MDMNPEMMGEAQGEMVTCLMICLKPDGTAMVTGKVMPMPEGGEPAQSLDEAFEIARSMAESPDQGAEDEAMSAAQSGYNRKAQPQMSAPSPEGLFGE